MTRTMRLRKPTKLGAASEPDVRQDVLDLEWMAKTCLNSGIAKIGRWLSDCCRCCTRSGLRTSSTGEGGDCTCSGAVSGSLTMVVIAHGGPRPTLHRLMSRQAGKSNDK